MTWIGNRLAASGAAAIGERIAAIAVALLLLRSSLAHLANPYVFLDTIYSYQIVYATLGLWIAIWLPFLQLVLGICLLAGWWQRSAYVLAAILFLTFVAVQIVAMSRGLNIACGCFGSTTEVQIGWKTLTLAGVCAVACGYGLLLCRGENERCAIAAVRPSH